MDAFTNYFALDFWWSLIQGLATGATALWVWITARQKANTESIEKLRDGVNDRVSELDNRLIRVEKDVQHMPTHTDISKVHERINETNENVKDMQGNLRQISHTVGLIHEYLLNGGKR